jgi:hypothetical protein
MTRDELAAIIAESLRLLRKGEQPAAVEELAEALEQLAAEDAAAEDLPPQQWPAWRAAYTGEDCPF